MNLFDNIKNILAQGSEALNSGKAPDGLQSLLGPAALGALAGALLSSKAARGMAGGALLAGGGAYLWNAYKDRLGQAGASGQSPEASLPPSPAALDARAERLVRALVYAAKSDGHIDAAEQRAIDDSLAKLALGHEAQALIARALQEPLDPQAVASGVPNAQEALELFAVSCSVIDVDHFMERSYLDALAKALNIPDDVKDDLVHRLSAGRAV